MTDERSDTGSLLGADSEFTGKLTFMGTVRIEGRFEGEILSDDTLVVAAGGEVHGKLDRRCVELHPPGRLTGEVRTPSFQIERGALFQGQCVMPEEELAAGAENDEPPPPPEVE
jgi:cytoskeletal protein CcmA (bactofilin family)